MTVLITSFQKEASIQRCLHRVIDVLDAEGIMFNIIVLDDASTDCTVQKASLVNDSRIRIHVADQNVGKGQLIRDNLNLVDGEITGIFDGDLDLHPEVLVRGFHLISNDAEIGAAIGSKLHPASVVDYPIKRRILSRIFRLITRLLFGLAIADTQTGAKVFRTDDLRKAAGRAVSTGFVFDLEVLVRLNLDKRRVEELPINLEYDFNSSIGINSMFQVLKDLLKVWRDI
jgi:glycosyltransferase involved in cell wall biosynthesis